MGRNKRAIELDFDELKFKVEACLPKILSENSQHYQPNSALLEDLTPKLFDSLKYPKEQGGCFPKVLSEKHRTIELCYILLVTY